MARSVYHLPCTRLLIGAAFASGMLNAASAEENKSPIRLAVVTFLSGPAAGAIGVPARNGAELIIDAINDGTLPAPFDSPGLAGRPIEAVYVDESGGAIKQVTEFRNLVGRRSIDAVVGYISSGDCAAIAPVAEELKTLTVFATCGNPVFEERDYRYVFQTVSLPAPENIGLARFVAERFPDIRSVSGINPNYAWGQDSWTAFSSSLKVLRPEVKVADELWPKLFSGQYGAEITRLLSSGPDLIHTALWGGDLEAFISQAAPRGLFKRSQVVFGAGVQILPLIGRRLPDGTIISTLGPHGSLMPESDMAAWFIESYANRFGGEQGVGPTHYAEALIGLKAAFDKASAGADDHVSIEDVIDGFEYLEWHGLSGLVRMANGNGHQAILNAAIALTMYDEARGRVVPTEIVYLDAECVSPPSGWKSNDWIEAGFPGAKCR